MDVNNRIDDNIGFSKRSSEMENSKNTGTSNSTRGNNKEYQTYNAQGTRSSDNKTDLNRKRYGQDNSAKRNTPKQSQAIVDPKTSSAIPRNGQRGLNNSKAGSLMPKNTSPRLNDTDQRCTTPTNDVQDFNDSKNGDLTPKNISPRSNSTNKNSVTPKNSIRGQNKIKKASVTSINTGPELKNTKKDSATSKNSQPNLPGKQKKDEKSENGNMKRKCASKSNFYLKV